MRGFPVTDMMSAGSMDRVREAILAIFTNFKNKLGQSNYPIDRVADFVHAVSRNVTEVMARILAQQPLMRMPFQVCVP